MTQITTRTLALLLPLLLTVTTVQANGVFEPNRGQPPKSSDFIVPYTSPTLEDERGGDETRCTFDKSDVADIIYAGGEYRGKATSYQIDDSGHQATQFEVIVNSPKRSVSLFLGAYEPSMWTVAWTKGTTIKSVFITGYHRQVIAGLPSSVPIINSARKKGANCGYTFLSKSNIRKVNPLSKKVFGKPVGLMHYAKQGHIVMGEKIVRSTRLFTSNEVSLNSFVDRSKPLAGKAGLDDYMKKGFLRKVTAEDLDKWAELKAKQAYDIGEGVPPVADRDPRDRTRAFRPARVQNGYVILKEMTIPAGLYGAHMATFFVAKGVPLPKGNLGHSVLYDFNTGNCKGQMCNRGR